MTGLLLLVTLAMPAEAREFWSLEGPPSVAPDARAVHSLGPLPPPDLPVPLALALAHGPDTSSGADVPEGGFSYKRKKKPVLSYVGGGLATFGLLYLGNARSLGFEARDAPTAAKRDAYLQEQQTRKTIGLSLLGTAGACFVVDIFI